MLWSIPLFALALSAPCRALMLLLHEALHDLPAGMAITYPKDDDPIYVLGSVEKDAEAAADAKDSGRLVVRRSGRQVPTPFFHRLLKVDRSPEKFSYLDVFFISDSTEQRAYDWMLADLRKTAVIAAVWVALSSWLLAQGGKAVQLWRRRAR